MASQQGFKLAAGADSLAFEAFQAILDVFANPNPVGSAAIRWPALGGHPCRENGGIRVDIEVTLKHFKALLKHFYFVFS